KDFLKATKPDVEKLRSEYGEKLVNKIRISEEDAKGSDRQILAIAIDSVKATIWKLIYATPQDQATLDAQQVVLKAIDAATKIGLERADRHEFKDGYLHSGWFNDNVGLEDSWQRGRKTHKITVTVRGKDYVFSHAGAAERYKGRLLKSE